MDGQRFDSLARAVAAGTSRRQVLRLLAGGAAGGLLGLVGLRAAYGQACRAAGSLCNKDANCCAPATCDPAGQRCVCPPGTENCRGVCKTRTDYQGDVLNCGACGNRCPVDQCNRATCTNGVCGLEPNPVRIGKSCDDGHRCTVGDVCRSDGVCQGSPKDCSALSDQCNDGVCDPATGNCVKRPKENGTGCDDGNACTQTDTCQNGQCVGGNPVVCTASDPCHDAGTCDPATGLCSNPAKQDNTPCGTNQRCCGGACVPNDVHNCNGCGNVCPGPFPHATVTCFAPGESPRGLQGGCEFDCVPGWHDCDRNHLNGCEFQEVPQSDSRCGICPPGQNCQAVGKICYGASPGVAGCCTEPDTGCTADPYSYARYIR